MAPLTLYQYPLCPYCAKVRRLLRQLNVPHETVNVPVGDTSALKALGKELAPVIVDGDVVMGESADICRYIADKYGAAA